jgi:hypothetical protein
MLGLNTADACCATRTAKDQRRTVKLQRDDDGPPS